MTVAPMPGTPSMAQEPCPCGSGGPLAACCGPWLADPGSAPTAEALMRSRYTAYVRGDGAYLAHTWHPSTRPAALDLDAARPPTWLGLEILGRTGGGVGEAAGSVEFVARFELDGRSQALHELSRFVREAGRWYYLDGRPPLRRAPAPPGRNRACPCGSGKKFKHCCGPRR